MRDSLLNYSLKNALFPFLCVIFTIAYYVSAHELKPVIINYPLGIMVVLAVLFIWTVYDEGRSWAQTKEEKVSGTATFIISLLQEWKKPLLMLVVLIGYILLIEPVGFYVSTAVFLLVQFVVLGLYRPITIILNLVVLLIVCYMLFQVWLNLSLPSGVLI